MHIENYYATLHLIPTALVGKCYLILYNALLLNYRHQMNYCRMEQSVINVVYYLYWLLSKVYRKTC